MTVEKKKHSDEKWADVAHSERVRAPDHYSPMFFIFSLGCGCGVVLSNLEKKEVDKVLFYMLILIMKPVSGSFLPRKGKICV